MENNAIYLLFFNIGVYRFGAGTMGFDGITAGSFWPICFCRQGRPECEQPELVPFVNGAGYDTESYHSKDFYFLKGITRDTVYDLGDEKESLNVLL